MTPHCRICGYTPRVCAPISARDVKAGADFVAIAGRYTRLRRAGRQYVGLCPFHSERHPSFYVHPERKIFHCFGCGAGGDVFDFIMRAEGCDFSRALEVAVGFGVAAVSELRSSERLDGGVGAKPLKAAKQPISHSPESPTERARLIARLDAADQRLAAIRRANLLRSRALATACEPLTEAEVLLLETGKQL